MPMIRLTTPSAHPGGGGGGGVGWRILRAKMRPSLTPTDVLYQKVGKYNFPSDVFPMT